MGSVNGHGPISATMRPVIVTNVPLSVNAVDTVAVELCMSSLGDMWLALTIGVVGVGRMTHLPKLVAEMRRAQWGLHGRGLMSLIG